jgi:hypothetical protein
MQAANSDTVSSLMSAAAGDVAALTFLVIVAVNFPGMIEERLEARAEQRKRRKLPERFQMVRAAINAKRQPPPSLINEGERGELLRAIEQTLTSMPFGRESFDAVKETLKRERKKYAAHSVRKPRKAGGGSERVKKGYELYQQSVGVGEPPDWEAIAYDCLKLPGIDTAKETWKVRRNKFRKSVDSHRYRLEKEARQREK